MCVIYVREGLQGGLTPLAEGLVLRYCWGGRPPSPEFLVLLRGGVDPPRAQSWCHWGRLT